MKQFTSIHHSRGNSKPTQQQLSSRTFTDLLTRNILIYSSAKPHTDGHYRSASCQKVSKTNLQKWINSNDKDKGSQHAKKADTESWAEGAETMLRRSRKAVRIWVLHKSLGHSDTTVTKFPTDPFPSHPEQ